MLYNNLLRVPERKNNKKVGICLQVEEKPSPFDKDDEDDDDLIIFAELWGGG